MALNLAELEAHSAWQASNTYWYCILKSLCIIVGILMTCFVSYFSALFSYQWRQVWECTKSSVLRSFIASFFPPCSLCIMWTPDRDAVQVLKTCRKYNLFSINETLSSCQNMQIYTDEPQHYCHWQVSLIDHSIIMKMFSCETFHHGIHVAGTITNTSDLNIGADLHHTPPPPCYKL